MSQVSLRTLGKRRDTLELKGDQAVATDEQIREHCPELFDTFYYLDQIREALSSIANFPPSSSIKSRLEEEDQRRLDDFLSHLLLSIQYQLTQIPFEFDVEQLSSDCDEGDQITRERKVTIKVKNADELLASIEQPLQDLEKLHNLSSLLSQIQSYINRTKASLPNFQDHNRYHEIEIQVLRGELNDLLEQEKEGELNRAEKAQKEQLEKEIGKHQVDAAKNSKKLNKRKSQISRQQKNIDQLIQMLTEFLRRFDPNNPESLPEDLNPDVFTNENIQFSTFSIKTNLQGILRRKREGEYTSYNADLAKSFRWMERKQFLVKWSRRLVFPLIIVGATAYTNRERITDFVLGPKMDPSDFGRDGFSMPTDPELIEQLEANNTKIAYYKVRILQSTTEMSEKQRQAIIESKDMGEFGKAFWRMINWSVVRRGNEFSIGFKPNVVKLLKAYLYDDEDDVCLGYTLGNIDEAEPFATLGVGFDVPKHVFCHPNFKVFIRDKMTKPDKDGNDVYLTMMLTEGRYLQKGRCPKALAKLLEGFPKGDALSDLVESLTEKRRKKKFSLKDLGLTKVYDSKIIEDVKEANVNILKTHLKIIERFKGVLSEEEFERIALSSKTISQYWVALMHAFPNCTTERVEGSKVQEVKIKLNPDLAEAIKLVYGEGTDVSLYFSGDDSWCEVVEYMPEFTVSLDDFCSPASSVAVMIRRPDSRGNLEQVIGHTVHSDDFYKEHCSNKVDPAPDYEELGRLRWQLFNSPLVKYMNIDSAIQKEIDSKKTTDEFIRYMAVLLKRMKTNPQFMKELTAAVESQPNILFSHLTDVGNGKYKVDYIDESFDYSNLTGESTMGLFVHPSLLNYLSAHFGLRREEVMAKFEGTVFIKYLALSVPELCLEDSPKFNMFFRTRINEFAALRVNLPLNFERDFASLKEKLCIQSFNISND